MIGYGNSMFLATHGILARSASGTPVDPDAQAFITAAAITDPTQQAAINTLVVDLKGYSIWTKMKALYPFVGGTSTTMKWNLKDPRDLDAAFRLQFIGGGTWDNNGYTPNGTNGYADTKLALNTLTRDSNSSGIYIRTNDAGAYTEYGVFNSGTTGSLQLSVRGTDNNSYVRNGSSSFDTIANTDSRGFYQITRRNSTQIVYSKNTTKTTISRTATDVFSNPSFILIGALNFGSPSFYSIRQYAFAYFGNTSLSDTELDNMNTAVQAFQTTLGRQV
jgi:hypothetical protein